MSDNNYSQHFSKKAFVTKCKEIGGELLDSALLLYLVLKAEETPTSAKIAITAALGYLVWPFDLVPDFIPVLGYLDDLAMLACLLSTVDRHLTPELREQAKRIKDEI